MTLESFIFPYWLIFAALVGRAIYIRKVIIVPTLKKYGEDYQEYMSFKKLNLQLEKYIELCNKHSLPDKHWRYMKFYKKIGFVLVIGWVILIIAADPQ